MGPYKSTSLTPNIGKRPYKNQAVARAEAWIPLLYPNSNYIRQSHVGNTEIQAGIQ